jgi:hypothetical protein
VPAVIKALWLLGWALVRSLLRRLVTRRDGIHRFRKNYDPDALPAVTPDERHIIPEFSRCIACGLCDRGEGGRIANSGGAYRGVMGLMVSSSRGMPDFRAAAYSFSFVPDGVLEAKERLCPTGVPMRQIARFVRDKADAVGGPLPLPAQLASLPSRSEIGV